MSQLNYHELMMQALKILHLLMRSKMIIMYLVQHSIPLTENNMFLKIHVPNVKTQILNQNITVGNTNNI
jgi:hypothetical protein